jgi:pilus assembly protein Flp/PilA
MMARGARAMKLLRDTMAVTALEYGIVAGVLAVALIALFKSFGGTISTVFSGLGGSI